MLALIALTVMAAAGITVAASRTMRTLTTYLATEPPRTTCSTGGMAREDLIFPLDGADHIDAKNVSNYLDAVYGGKKRGVLLLNDSDGVNRARRSGGAYVCYVDPDDSSRSCPHAAPGSQPEGPFEAHMRPLIRDR